MHWNVSRCHTTSSSLPPMPDLPPLPLKPLMLLQVFEILVQGLFDPTQRLPAETQRTYVQLLATAAAAIDDRSAHASFDSVDAVKERIKKAKRCIQSGKERQQDCGRSLLPS